MTLTFLCVSFQDAQGCDSELHALREDQKNLGQLLEAKQIRCRELESNADSLDGDIERQLEAKQRVCVLYLYYTAENIYFYQPEVL